MIAEDPTFYKAVWTDPDWAQLPAVKAKRVYLAPSEPFGWIDEPPAANRLIGLRWLVRILYPSALPDDLAAETKQFYELFYQRTPTDAQVAELLAGALPAP